METLRLPTESLKRTLIHAERSADAKSSIPALWHVRIQACSQGIEISATDLETTRRERIKYASGMGTEWPTWTACVSAKRLKALMPKNKKDLARAPVTKLTLDQAYRETLRDEMTFAECEAYRQACPPRLTDGREPGRGELIGKWLAIGDVWSDRAIRAMVKADPRTELCDREWIGKLKVSVGGAETILQTLDPDEYPTLPQRSVGHDHATYGGAIDGLDFRDLIAKTLPAISTEESRFQLSG